MLFIAYNAAMPTTAAMAPVANNTSGAIRTMLQIATPATRVMRPVRWGVTLSSAPTTRVDCELIDTNVAATVTAHVAAGVQPYDRTNGTPASLMTLGTTATGYTATAEGSITATRIGDMKYIPIGASNLEYEWSLGREWEVAPSRFCRIRLTSTSTTISSIVWMIWDE